jgi:hypothetical protein
MMTLVEIRAKLQDRRPAAVTEATGLSYGTIKALRDDPNANPTLNVMNLLTAYFNDKSVATNEPEHN